MIRLNFYIPPQCWTDKLLGQFLAYISNVIYFYIVLLVYIIYPIFHFGFVYFINVESCQTVLYKLPNFVNVKEVRQLVVIMLILYHAKVWYMYLHGSLYLTILSCTIIYPTSYTQRTYTCTCVCILVLCIVINTNSCKTIYINCNFF